MMVEIRWFVEFSRGLDIITQSLDRVSADLMKNYPGSAHHQCPAWKDSLNDTYILRSPMDVSIRLNKKNNIIQANKFVDKDVPFIMARDVPDGMDQQFSCQYFFYFITNHDDVMIEQLPAFYHINDFTKNCTTVGGQFNVAKWTRPINLTAAIVTTESEEDIYIHIKKGDPLSYVRFTCKDNIKLKRITDIEEMIQISHQSKTCIDVKMFQANTGLKKLYEIFKPFNRKYKKSCPFNIFKRGE